MASRPHQTDAATSRMCEAALECVACLNVLVAKGKCTADQIQSAKGILHETVCPVVGLQV